MTTINRWMSRREKRAGGAQDRKPRLLTEDIHSLFSAQPRQKVDKEEDKKVKALAKRLLRLGIQNLKEPQIEFSLRTPYADGDPDRAFELLVLFEDSIDGVVKPYDPSTHLVGAVNRHFVTCYLDAVLFAMFARLDSFEALLYKSFNDRPRQRLAVLLRLWVNMLRTGKLISTDLTERLQDALADCGWKDAAKLRQQDASEAFTFLTETLELPHLTLKMDIFHTGKEDASDDHKFVRERLLEVAIPALPEGGQTITLEDCLETYFNNRIEVKRHLEQQQQQQELQRRSTGYSLRSVDSAKVQATHVELVELDSLPTTPLTPVSSTIPVFSRHRAPSIIRERLISGTSDRPSSSSSRDGSGSSTSPRKMSVKKEVMMPAWQFFSLIPWYTEGTPSSDAQVAAHFSAKRPILGLALKRYSMLPNGTAVRRDTQVDIPLEIGLPSFIQDDKMGDDGPLFGNFKLSLQSVVCHRGNSVDAGHYVSFVRGQVPAEQARTSTDVSGDEAGRLSATNHLEPEDRWMRLDDLAKVRVSTIDIKKALLEESPYLLFYQVQPIEEPVVEPVGEPPPYEESRIGTSGTSRTVSSIPASSRDSISSSNLESHDPSRRQSISALPTSETMHLISDVAERRRSTALTESQREMPKLWSGNSTGVNKDGDESRSTSASVSRRPSQSGNGSSQTRSTSQPADRRLSATFSRLANRMSRDKLEPQIVLTGVNNDEPSVLGQAEHVEHVESKHKLKKEKRAKSRSRGKTVKSSQVDGEPKAPDRECSLM